MPWRQTNVMQQREMFINAWLSQKYSKIALCVKQHRHQHVILRAQRRVAVNIDSLHRHPHLAEQGESVGAKVAVQADKQVVTHENSPKSASLTRHPARHNKSLPAAVETVQ